MHWGMHRGAHAGSLENDEVLFKCEILGSVRRFAIWLARIQGAILVFIEIRRIKGTAVT
jgi:hypothetical protein